MSLGAQEQSAIRSELKRILESAAFRGSKRCQQFLTYLVENTLAGCEEALKERSIGVTLFSRSPSYETGEDAIVRVTAKEVRQRLKQYFSENATPQIRIDLPAGSYTAEFHPAGVGRISARWFSPRRVALLAGVLAAALAAVAVLARFVSNDPVDLFWSPIVSDSGPVLIAVSNPTAYQFTDELYSRLHDRRPTAPDDLIHGSEVLPVSVVGIGDARATAVLTSFFGLRGKRSQVRIANDLSFSDLRNSVTVMIGAFTNRWTLQMTDELRFVFQDSWEGPRKIWSIRDRQTGKNWNLHNTLDARSDSARTDYGVISRVFRGHAGRPFVVVAGVGDAGTQACAECLVSLECLGTVARNAPAGWQRKNLQVMISTRSISGIAGPPEVQATHFW